MVKPPDMAFDPVRLVSLLFLDALIAIIWDCQTKKDSNRNIALVKKSFNSDPHT
jgi:hypothetical protein